MRAINEAAGTDLDFGEEDVIPKDAVPAAITAVGQCVPPATTPKALQTLLAPLRGIDKLLLLDDRPRSDSPVSRAVASAHLRAFLWFCLEAAIRCLWTDAPEAPSPALVLP